jgi:hypothetical protein
VVLICSTGCFVIPLSSPLCKNKSLRDLLDTPLLIPPFRLTEGRIAIVTDARRDAVDAAALLTNSASADGEVVWS